MKLKIEEKIGNGGQAEVYRATDEEQNQYAVKIFFRYVFLIIKIHSFALNIYHLHYFILKILAQKPTGLNEE